MSSEQLSYRAAFRTPNAARSFVPSAIGRLSLATSTLALVLLLERETGSYAIAGVVTATLAIANVIATPWRARLIDRRGQTVVLVTLGIAYALALTALALAPDLGLPALLCLGVVAGASTPPFATCMRVLWSAALPPGGLRQRAFSVDAVAGEVSYAIGPLIAALVAATFAPLASVLLAACGVLIGALLFASSPLSREQRGSDRLTQAGTRTPSPLRTRGFPPVVIAMVAPGIVLGAVDIAAPAIADAQSSTALSGVLLALFAGASGVSGLIYGSARFRLPLERQLVMMTLALIVVTATTGVFGGTVAGLIGFAVSGLCLAPGLIAGYLAANARAEVRVRTEANGWMDTAVQFGAALGAAVSGALTDTAEPGHALAVTMLVPLGIIAASSPYLLRTHDRTADK